MRAKKFNKFHHTENLLFGVLIQMEDVKPAITKEKQGLKEKRKKKTPLWKKIENMCKTQERYNINRGNGSYHQIINWTKKISETEVKDKESFWCLKAVK